MNGARRAVGTSPHRHCAGFTLACAVVTPSSLQSRRARRPIRAILLGTLILCPSLAGAQQKPLIWLRDGKLSSQAAALVSLMGAARGYGLRPEDYLRPDLPGEIAAAAAVASSEQDRVRLDADLTVAATRFVTHLHYGRIDPRRAGFELGSPRADLDVAATVANIANSRDVSASIAAVEPTFYHYGLLKAALARYRALASSGAAVAAGSARHDVAIPLPRRIMQIELSLERMRWLPAFEAPPIIVNIPQFELFAFQFITDRAAAIARMRVIVGKAYPATQTPIFVGQMKHVVFRPYWNVPRSIVAHELMARIKANPGYMDRNGFEIVDGQSDRAHVVAATRDNIAALEAGRLRLRQRPGGTNALGLVKFLFPNTHDVYLHSTPSPGLFAKSSRAFSHGCIRVADPVGLAAYVLRNSPGEWTPDKIRAAMSGDTTQSVTLQTSIPVIIFYSTVLATEAGDVLFFDDVYGHDRKLEELLDMPATEQATVQHSRGREPLAPYHVANPGQF